MVSEYARFLIYDSLYLIGLKVTPTFLVEPIDSSNRTPLSLAVLKIAI